MKKYLATITLLIALCVLLIPFQANAINLQAINVARNSTQFQSVMKGYGYSYIGYGWSESKRVKSISLNFLQFNDTKFVGRQVGVEEDWNATSVIGVYTYQSICHGMFPCPIPLINQTKYVWNTPSPLQQAKQGIGFKDIVCSYDFVELSKTGDNSAYPICVTQSTSWKLVERGWALVNHNYTYIGN